MCFWESRRTTNDGMLTTWPRERSSYTPASRGLRPACPFWTVAGLSSLSRQSLDSDYQEQVCLLRH